MEKNVKSKSELYYDAHELAQLPENEIQNEWIAYNLANILRQATLLYHFMAKVCKCDKMTASAHYEYFWVDGDKKMQLTAIDYAEKAIEMAETIIADTKIFPIEPGIQFSHIFTKNAKTIMRRLFRIFVHVYFEHYADLEANQIEKDVELALKFCLALGKQFELLGHEDLDVVANI